MMARKLHSMSFKKEKKSSVQKQNTSKRVNSSNNHKVQDNTKGTQFQITADTVLGVIFQDPKLVEILYKNGVPCVGCPMLGFEANFLTLGQIADTYDLDLKKLLKELNQAIKQKQQDG